MPDLLTHALVAYVLFAVVSLRYEWVSPQYVTIGMVGAFIPDLAKIDLLVDGSVVAAFLGVPFGWFGIHTLGGSVVVVLIGVVLAAEVERRRVFALLSVGVASHLFLDALLYKVTGVSYPVFWPLTLYRPPTPGLYLSTDVWPSLIMVVIAILTWYVVRKRPTKGNQQANQS